MEKQTEAQQMQLQALYNEKLMQLERLEKTFFNYLMLLQAFKNLVLNRLRIQYDSLVKKEAEQTEFIEQFTSHK